MDITTDILKFLIPAVFATIAFFLIKYDRNKELKQKHILWLSRKLFQNKTDISQSAQRLHQSLLGFAFIFFAGIAILFIVALFKEYMS